jgi:hypothetical protein
VYQLQVIDLHKVKIESLWNYLLGIFPTHIMDVYKPYLNATERAKKNNFNVDQMQFIDKTPYDKIHDKLCKFIQFRLIFRLQCFE